MVDFSSATITMQHKRELDMSKDTLFNFRDVKECYLPSKDILEKISDIAPWSYTFPFYVEIKDRKYLLFVFSEEEREMWVHGFTYVIKSTEKAQ